MKKNLKNMISENNFDDEIYISNIFSFIFRNLRFIGKLSFLFFIVACLYSLTLKKVWEGGFQIVLNADSNSDIRSAFSNLIKTDDDASNLKTQVGILESPSVLMPIFDFVNGNDEKNYKSKKSFSKWKKNLNIKLESGTSILNINYRDTNKDIILPALKKMSSIYQDYSGRKIRRSQQLTKEYLEDQIQLFRKKSSQSIKSAQNFAIEQNLNYLGSSSDFNNSIQQNDNGFNTTSDNSQPLFKRSIVNIENTRVNAANKIRMINLQIAKINALEPSDYESLQYFGSAIPALSNEGLPQTLKTIEERLVKLRTQYTEKDRSIISLLEERKLIVDLLKSRAIKYLKVSKLETEALMEASMRPKGILLKYKELMRTASRDESTLVSLEGNLSNLKLQIAQKSNPWELITQPTLLTSPVAPSKREIGLFGFLFGGILGVVISFYKEKKSGKIFSLQKLENLLSQSPLEKINKNEEINESQQIQFLKKFLKNQNAKKIAFIYLEEINKSYMNDLREFLNKDTNLGIEINIVSSQYDLDEYKNAEFIILFTSLYDSSLVDIKTFINKISFLDLDFKGFVLLEQ